MLNYPKVAIVYLSFHSEPYLGDVVAAFKKVTYPKDKIECIIVDNPHPTHGSSVRFIEETVMPLSGKELPHITLLAQKENLGFAGGNNVGIKWAIDHGFEYVYFHNNDGFVAAQFLEPLVETMENDKTIGAAQSLLMLHPETNLINTTGNSMNYLAIGFCTNFRVPRDKVKLKPVEDINYASGAAMLMRVDLLQQYGLWDHDFFLYHEDLEYSYRLKAAGYKIVMASNSIFYHKYSFGRNEQKFYYIERNRWAVMLMYYRWPTLLLIAPMGLLLELGMLVLALKQGWWKSKMAAYGYWLRPSSWKLWLAKRRRVQLLRRISDRQLLRGVASSVVFDDKTVNNPALRYVGNPLMSVYWAVVKHIIFW